MCAYRVGGQVSAVYPSVPKLDDNKKPLKNEDGSFKLTAPALQVGGRDGIRLQCDPDQSLPEVGSEIEAVARRDSFRGADGNWVGIMKLSMVLSVTPPRRVKSADWREAEEADLSY